MNENKNQLKAITKEIKIYKIIPKKELNFPPLIDLVIRQEKKKIKIF